MSAASGPTMKTLQKRLYGALPRIQSSSAGASSASTSTLSSSPPSSSSMALANRTRSSSISHARTLYTASFTPGGTRGPPVSARLEGRVEGVELPNGSIHHPHSHAGTSSGGGGNGGVSSNPHHPPNVGPPAWHMGLNSSSYTPQTVLPPSSPYSYVYGYTPYPSLAGALDPAKEDTTEGAWWLATPETTPNADPTTGVKFHLDVGAYGIPKRQRGGRSRHASYRRPTSQAPSPQSTSTEDLSLAVPVGEDAYFVRPTAMGVADGVGGWSTRPSAGNSACTSTAHQREKSASALFARRLMHFCSAELDGLPESSTSATTAGSLATPQQPLTTSPSPPTHTYRAPLSALRARSTSPKPTPRPAAALSNSNPTANAILSAPAKTRVHSPRHNSIPLPAGSPRNPNQGLPNSPKAHVQALHEQLEHELEEMEEGLDVLRILEKAYEKTLKAHVEPVSAPVAASSSSKGLNVPQSRRSSLDGERTCPALKITSSADTTAASGAGVDAKREKKPLMAGSTTALLAILDNSPKSDPGSAMLRIAHLGDSMGMLVRGEEIVWRTEEQWSSWNTPVQLGPRAGTKPSAAAVLSVPVMKDDILILATDGLSDNLWDDQVLQEVVRFRRQFLGGASSVVASEEQEKVGGTAMGMGKEVGRRAMAGMLSEALCSLARRVSERGHARGTSCAGAGYDGKQEDAEEEVPFTKRAREAGRVFRGGKADDISVVVAVISPS